MSAGTSTRQGEIVLVPFPYSDLSQSKKRPALIISSDDFNRGSQDVICCLITSNPAKAHWTVGIDNSDMESGFLDYESKIKPYRLFTVSKQRIYRSLGVLKKDKLNDAISMLHVLTPKV